MYPPDLAYTDHDAHALMHEVEELYRKENLMVPPLASDLPALQRISPRSFATQALPGQATVYDVGSILGGILRGEVEERFAAFGLGGHGFMSQAVHYHFATAQVVVLLQLRWGTIIDDVEAARTRYNIYMGWCKRLERESMAAMVRGAFPEGQRAMVVQSELTGKRWAWVPAHTPVAAEGVEWRQSVLDPIFVVAQEIRNMIR